MHVELGASGSFNLRVTDARRLLLRLVGTTGGLVQEQVFSGMRCYIILISKATSKRKLGAAPTELIFAPNQAYFAPTCTQSKTKGLTAKRKPEIVSLFELFPTICLKTTVFRLFYCPFLTHIV